MKVSYTRGSSTTPRDRARAYRNAHPPRRSRPTGLVVVLPWLLLAATFAAQIAYPLVDGERAAPGHHRVGRARPSLAWCTHASAHRGPRGRSAVRRRHRGWRAGRGGGRRAHRRAVRRLLLHRDAGPGGARRARRRAARLDDDGLPGAARGPAAHPALDRGRRCVRAGRRGTSSSTRRWSPTGAGAGPTRRRRCPASTGVPLTNFAGWLAAGSVLMLLLDRPAAARRLPPVPTSRVPAALLVWTWVGLDPGQPAVVRPPSAAPGRRRRCWACSSCPTRGRCGSRGP